MGIVRNVTFKPSDASDWHTLIKINERTSPLIVNYQLPRNLPSDFKNSSNLHTSSKSLFIKPLKIQTSQKSIDIPPRDTTKIDLFVNDIIFNSENHLDVLVAHCTWPWPRFNKIPLQFSSTLNISLWYGHSELIQTENYHYIDCSPKSSSDK